MIRRRGGIEHRVTHFRMAEPEAEGDCVMCKVLQVSCMRAGAVPACMRCPDAEEPFSDGQEGLCKAEFLVRPDAVQGGAYRRDGGRQTCAHMGQLIQPCCCVWACMMQAFDTCYEQSQTTAAKDESHCLPLVSLLPCSHTHVSRLRGIG